MPGHLKRTGAALALSILLTGPVAAQEFVTIGTGGVTGVYFPAGGAVCRMVNRERKKHGVRCSVESTGGSVENIAALRDGELDFGVVQSDVQSAAVAGTGAFADTGPFAGLRALFSVHTEPLHVMARSDSGITDLDSMKGKAVNIGNPGSGTRVLSELMLQYAGISLDDFGFVAEVSSFEQADALCDGEIDASIWVAGMPNGAAQQATASCDVTLIPLSGPPIDSLLAENPPFTAAVIPGGMYLGNPNDIPTWGPTAVFVTTADTPDQVVYVMVRALFENFEDFKTLHPAFAQLREEEMVKGGLTAELHPGALKYYRERGWK